jgi:hypothetical protein
MQSAVIIMSILGCDASGSNCTHLETLEKRWPTLALCDVAASGELNRRIDYIYPVIVSICETPEAFDAVEDGHEGAMVDANGKLLMQGSNEAESEERTSRSIKTRLGQTQEANGFDIIKTPERLIKGTWRWIRKQF